MTVQFVSPAQAKLLLQQGADLIDIREIDEHRRERIALARNLPLSSLKAGTMVSTAQTVIFHCKSGTRTRGCIPVLSQVASGKIHVLDGSTDAWRKDGLPLLTDTRQPMEMMRQVQIAAGSLVLLGAVLGFAVAPAFYALSAAVGAGLVFSGVSGTCAMAAVLKSMPWNKQAA